MGVRLDPANPQCLTDAKNLRRTVAPNLPIHWNFPTFVLSEPGYQVWYRFTDSFAEERDAILPMGFAGLHHPMLQLDELRRELDWGFSNPMASDDPLGIRSSVLLCRTPDLCRPQALSL